LEQGEPLEYPELLGRGFRALVPQELVCQERRSAREFLVQQEQPSVQGPGPAPSVPRSFGRSQLRKESLPST